MRFYCKKWNDAFLRYFLDSELFKNQIQEQLQGIQPNFGPTHLRKVVIPVPPIEEQKRIVTKIDQLMTLCNQLVTLCNQLETNIREKNETAACYANAIVQQIAAA
jgi:type I restriction enzyme S subunit